MQNLLPVGESSTNEFSIKEHIYNYLYYWKWFVLSVLCFLIGTFVYMRYYVPQYGVATSILIKDERKGGSSELSAFSDLNIFSSKNNIDNEIAILKSRTLSQNVVKELNLDLAYFSEGRLVYRELYKDSPVEVIFQDKSSNYYEKDTTFIISIVNKNEFTISNSKNSDSKNTSLVIK